MLLACVHQMHTTILHNPAALNLLPSMYLHEHHGVGGGAMVCVTYVCTYSHMYVTLIVMIQLHIMSSNHAQRELTHPPNLTCPPNLTRPLLSVPALSLASELLFADCCCRNLPASLKMAVARRSVLIRPH